MFSGEITLRNNNYYYYVPKQEIKDDSDWVIFQNEVANR